MKIKIAEGGKKIIVDVNKRECLKLPCFKYGHYTHHSSVGSSGTSSRTDDGLSCLTRDRFGCPNNKEL